jgi:hypothetical protein
MTWHESEKTSSTVILSAAKDLHSFVLQKIMQMLRCAQHDKYAISNRQSTIVNFPPAQVRVLHSRGVASRTAAPDDQTRDK